MLSTIKPQAEKYIQRFAKNLPIPPNLLTILGTMPSLLFFVFVIEKLFILALIISPFQVIDMLDGAVARSQKKVTAFGGFLDSTLDRVSDFFIITAFGFAHLVRWEIILPLLLITFLISYTRSRGELASFGKVSFAVGIIERTERLLIIFFSVILYLFFPLFLWQRLNIVEIIFIILTILSAYTCLQRIVFAYNKLGK